MLTSTDIRRQFIDFFVEKHGHAFVPSSPVVPHDDPTLLFTNAGMNQFKPCFLGTAQPEHPRVANTQKCIRAGGKHNDLEDVGKDTYHHTFFEMLGNWSFGDYFKKEAIAWAWELLTEVWGLDKSRLHATVFEGDAGEGLEPDREAAGLWRTVTDIDPSHIHLGNKKDNFWEMGDTGPCGPCSEIHIDLTPDRSGAALVNGGDARVIEIWNLVFIQFNRRVDGTLEPLPAKHVDTGMGFERVAAVLQGKTSNYDTDVFAPLFAAIRDLTGARPYGGDLHDPIDVAYRVIGDHIRCLTFAITDGAAPSNDGRGYVLRRILRRAVRHGRQTLGMHEPFLHKLVPAVADAMGEAFPELRKNPARVADIIREEEESFGKTIDRGIQLWWNYAGTALAKQLEEDQNPEADVWIHEDGAYIATDEREKHERPLDALLGRSDALSMGPDSQITFERGGQVLRQIRLKDLNPVLTSELTRTPPIISAEGAFRLHDTYGFPLDLTQVMAEERGMTVDVDGFNKLMEEAREQSRAGGGSTAGAMDSLLAVVQRESLGPTQFDGYENEALELDTPGRLYRLGAESYEPAAEAQTGDRVAVVLDRTCFYAESGGQVGDVGTIAGCGNAVVDVRNTIRVGQTIFHLGQVTTGTLKASPDAPRALRLAVDSDRRAKIRANHTSTHMLNRALRKLVNPEADQKGSLVDDQKLRFDFSHHAAVATDQLAAVEKMVNDDIAADLPVYYDYAPQEQARRINGLRAVFGEKYPPTVRIVSIGAKVSDLLAEPHNERWADYSIEFCGGTHLKTTGDAEGFVIVSEEAVAKGVRRITAQTGRLAHETQAQGERLLARLAALRGGEGPALEQGVTELTAAMQQHTLAATAAAELRAGIAELQKQIKQQQKQQNQAAEGQVVEAARAVAETSDGPVIVATIDGADAQSLRTAMDVIRKKRPEAAMLLAAVSDGKIAFLAAVPADKIKAGLKAGDWVREVAQAAGGGGGGRPDMAQAGGKDPSKLDHALAVARQFAQSKSS